MSVENEWLNLSETAELLGVHPATIRVWADRGELPSHRTPGGHRRFRRSEVENRATGQDRAHLTAAQLVIQNMLGKARLELTGGEANLEAWHKGLDEIAKNEHREIGRRLLSLVVQYISGAVDETAVLQQAQQIGQDYARMGRETSLPLVETTRAYLFFREFMSQSIFDMMETAGPQTHTDWRRIHRQLTCITNEVLLALMAAHEQHNP